jgi:hypothetical protein
VRSGTSPESMKKWGKGRAELTRARAERTDWDDLIRQRTLAGLAARARGRTGGRPPSMTPIKIAIARQIDAQKHSLAFVAASIVWLWQRSNPTR